jgi:hypothetical protein
MKLKVDFKPLLKKQKEATEIKSKAKSMWTSPIGWWNVSTEGDEEGRSTNNLGTYYGHVAEIAFHLANKAMYKLTFQPTTRSGKVSRPTYNATRTHVHISLDIDSGTWNMETKELVDWVQKWLDITDNSIRVTDSNYFAGFKLEYVG